MTFQTKAQEMIGTMMNSKNGIMMMQENQMMAFDNHSSIMNMLQRRIGIGGVNGMKNMEGMGN
jgi:hypothetical protein